MPKITEARAAAATQAEPAAPPVPPAQFQPPAAPTLPDASANGDSDQADQTEAAADADPATDKPAPAKKATKRAAAKKTASAGPPAATAPPAAPPAPAGPSAAPVVQPGKAPAALAPPTLPGLAEDTEWLSIGYYGREGSAKTTNALSAANRGQVILINAEAGAKPSALRRRGVNVENIRVFPNRAAGEELNFAGLENLLFTVKKQLADNPGSIYCICWDSLTEISYRLVSAERDRNLQQKTAEGKTVDRWFMDRSFYGVSTSQIQELIRRFRDLPCHFVLCALERRDTDDDGKVSYGPSVNPALATDIPGFVDILVHTEMVEVGGTGERGSGNDEYRGWFRVHGKYRAKERFGVVPKALPDPTFERIADYVSGDLTVETDQLLIAKREAAAAAAGGGSGEPDGQPPQENQAEADAA